MMQLLFWLWLLWLLSESEVEGNTIPYINVPEISKSE